MDGSGAPGRFEGVPEATWERTPAPSPAPGQHVPHPPPPPLPPPGVAPPPAPGGPSPYDPAPAPGPATKRGIGVVALLLVIVASVASLGATATLWASTSVTSRGTWDDVVVPLREDPEVVRLVTDEIVDLLEDDVNQGADDGAGQDPDERVDDLEDAVESAIEDGDFEREWRRIVDGARRELDAVIDGRASQAELDMDPLIETLQDDPQFSDDLADVRDVRVTIVRPEDAAPIRDGVETVGTAWKVLMAATLVAGALAVVVSRRRWRAGAVLGLSVAVAQVALIGLVVVGRGLIAAGAVDRAYEDVAREIATSATAGLVTRAMLTAAVGAAAGATCATIAFVRRPRPAAS